MCVSTRKYQGKINIGIFEKVCAQYGVRSFQMSDFACFSLQNVLKIMIKHARVFDPKKEPKKETNKSPTMATKPESDEKRKAALFSFNETASSGELCWLLLVVRIPMFSGSFCK